MCDLELEQLRLLIQTNEPGASSKAEDIQFVWPSDEAQLQYFLQKVTLALKVWDAVLIRGVLTSEECSVLKHFHEIVYFFHGLNMNVQTIAGQAKQVRPCQKKKTNVCDVDPTVTYCL